MAGLLIGRGEVQIELMDRQMPQPMPDLCPPPPIGYWARYRGDDLTGYIEGDAVLSWPDRAGSSGPLVPDTGDSAVDVPIYTVNAVGGQPGVYGRHGDEADQGVLYSPSGNWAVLNDITIVAIVRAPVDGYWGGGRVFFGWSPDYLGIEFDAPGQLLALTGYNDVTHQFVYETTTWPESQDELVLTARWDDDKITLAIGNTVVLTTASDGALTNNTDARVSVQTPPRIAEVITWDRALSDAEVGQVWEYAKCYYELEEPAPTIPEPWAWYRGDDLAATHNDGDSLDGSYWPDRAGGIGDLIFYGTSTFAASAINGQPAASLLDWVDIYHEDSLGIEDMQGITLLTVFSGAPAWHIIDWDGYFDFGSGSQHMYLGSLGTWLPAQEHWEYADFPPTSAVVGLWDNVAGRVQLIHNGSIYSEDTGSAEWGIWLDWLYIEFGANHNWLPLYSAELIFWDRGLTDEELAQVWAYVQDRYGL